MREERSAISAAYIMRPESIEAFWAAQRENSAARMDAEKWLEKDPQAFVMEQGRKKEFCV